MNCIDAIRAKLYPYTLPDETLEFLLDEQDLQASEVYDKEEHRTLLLKATIAALKQLKSIKKEKDNGSEVDYDPASISALIREYEDELKPASSRYTNRDLTHRW
jgi:hypothetical protein